MVFYSVIQTRHPRPIAMLPLRTVLWILNWRNCCTKIVPSTISLDGSGKEQRAWTSGSLNLLLNWIPLPTWYQHVIAEDRDKLAFTCHKRQFSNKVTVYGS